MFEHGTILIDSDLSSVAVIEFYNKNSYLLEVDQMIVQVDCVTEDDMPVFQKNERKGNAAPIRINRNKSRRMTNKYI